MEELDRSLHSPLESSGDGPDGRSFDATTDHEDEPLIVSDDPYVQDLLPNTQNGRYAPRDHYNLAFLFMMMLGMGTAYPWNFFVTATDYFHYSLRNLTNPEEPTQYQTLFETSLAAVATGCGFLGLCLSTLLTRYIGFRYRIYAGYLTIVAVFIITTAIAMRNTDSWQGGFFIATMANVLVINVANSMVSGGVFGIQGCLPARFSTAVMIGQPVAGAIAVLAEVISVVSGDESPTAVRKEATGYFASAIVATVLCMVALWFFLRLPFARYYLDSLKKGHGNVEQLDRSLGSSESETSLLAVKEVFPMKLVFIRTWKIGLALVLNFFVTVAVFPAIATAVLSQDAGNGSLITTKLFLPLTCFLLMNAGDFAGRLAHGALLLPSPEPRGNNITLLLSVLRIGLIPLFLFCNAHPRSHLPVLFGDAMYVTLIAVLSCTNGYIGNLAMMYGPKLVPAAAAETTGSLMGLYLNLGLFLGSIFSFALVYFL